MNYQPLRLIKVRDVDTPIITSIGNAGVDIAVPNDFKETKLKPHTNIRIKSGLRALIPKGYYLFMADRSSVSTKMGLKVVAPIIDSNYTGEFSICLYNYTNKSVSIEPGMRLAQIILQKYTCPTLIVEDMKSDIDIPMTDRGNKGFGSNGLYGSVKK
jgi:dUTP pyrophosphatase